MATPEAKLKQDVKKVLDRLGLWRAGGKRPNIPLGVTGWYYMPVQNGMGIVGIPDFICCYYGRFLAIETKAPGAKPTANQAQRHDEIVTGGGVVLVTDTAIVVEQLLNNMSRRSFEHGPTLAAD